MRTLVGEVEPALRSRFDAGDFEGMIALALRRYGSELYAFVRGLTRDRVRADDIFAITCERLWRLVPGFRWDSSFRVWAYTVARTEFLRDDSRNRRDTARAETPSELASDDDALVDLRSDRDMSWDEIAKVLGGDDANARDVARLRKRYERLREVAVIRR